MRTNEGRATDFGESMSCFGCKAPPYHSAGRRQCEERILADCRKLMAIVSEAEVSYDRALYLHALDRVQDAVRRVKKLRVTE
jgi:hypothetical protein